MTSVLESGLQVPPARAGRRHHAGGSRRPI